MATANRKSDFFDTDEGLVLKAKLVAIQTSDHYQTSASYSPNSAVYADNLIPFVDKHVNYLLKHPQLDPEHYIANLQILTRRR